MALSYFYGWFYRCQVFPLVYFPFQWMHLGILPYLPPTEEHVIDELDTLYSQTIFKLTNTNLNEYFNLLTDNFHPSF